jgi:hypothetical protein
MAVDSSHFLIRILESITVPQSMNLERYYANVDAGSLNVSMALKLTSPVFRGQIFNGIFYGPGNTEILIGHDESFDPFAAHDDWENLAPVKVLRHPISHLGMNIPDGKSNDTETGIAVIAINIPMLAVQYRAFRLNEIEVCAETGDSEKSIMEFIRMYVLPNMMTSHLDNVIFNRIDKMQRGIPFGSTKKHHSFYLMDWTWRVDYVHSRLLLQLNEMQRDFTGILRSIQLVTEQSVEDLMYFPDLSPTRQILWALVTARVNVLSFLYSVTKHMQGDRNGTETNRILRVLNSYGVDSALRQALPTEAYFDVASEIEFIARVA